MPVITNVEDLRLLAKKRVPRMFYDYADSGRGRRARIVATRLIFRASSFVSALQ